MNAGNANENRGMETQAIRHYAKSCATGMKAATNDCFAEINYLRLIHIHTIIPDLSEQLAINWSNPSNSYWAIYQG